MPGKHGSVSVGEHVGTVDSKVQEDRDSNANDVLRPALKPLEEQDAKLTAVRAVLIDGEESGSSTGFDFEAFIERKRNPETP